jgi:hypothetical protein
MAFEKDPAEIGALWLKSGKKGDYMTGEINGVKVVCFAVQAKSDKSPAWRVLKAKPKDSAPVRGQALSADDIEF